MCCKIIIDFTDPHKIYVVYELSAVFAAEGGAEAEHTFRIVYVLNAQSGELAQAYDLSFGGAHAIFKNGLMVRSEDRAVSVSPDLSFDQSHVTVGSGDLDMPFTETEPAWVGDKIYAGDKITLFGTLTFDPEQAEHLPAVYLFSGYVLGYWQTGKEPFNFNAEGLGAEYRSSPFEAFADVNGGSCEIIFDWTEKAELVISVTCVKDGLSASASLTLTGMDKEGYYIGLGGERCFYTAAVTRESVG